MSSSSSSDSSQLQLVHSKQQEALPSSQQTQLRQRPPGQIRCRNFNCHCGNDKLCRWTVDEQLEHKVYAGTPFQSEMRPIACKCERASHPAGSQYCECCMWAIGCKEQKKQELQQKQTELRQQEQQQLVSLSSTSVRAQQRMRGAWTRGS